MDYTEHVEKARTLIRDKGYMSAMEIAIKLGSYSDFPPDSDIGKVCEQIPCEDICVVEYACSTSAEYRRKDLFYYSP